MTGALVLRAPWAVAAAGAASLAAGGGLAAGALTGDAGGLMVVLVGAVGLLFLWRAEAGLGAILVVRPALDAFGGRGGSDPSGALAATALVACGAWLLVQRLEAPLPPGALVVVPLGATAVLSSALSAAPGPSLTAAGAVCASLAMFAVADVLLARGTPAWRVLGAVLLGGVAPATVGLAQSFGGAGWVGPDGVARLQGTFAHPNPFGASLGLEVILLVAVFQCGGARARAAAAIGAVPLVYLLALTGSRSAWLATAAGILAVTARSSLRQAAVCAAVLAVLLVTPAVQARLGDLSAARQLDGHPANSAVWRLDQWRDALHLATRSPVTGLGLGAVGRASAVGKDPHNDIVRVIVELGALGVLAGCLVAVEAARRFAAEWPRPPTLGGSAALGAITATAVLAMTTNLLGSFAVMTPALVLCAMARRDGREPMPARPAPSGATA